MSRSSWSTATPMPPTSPADVAGSSTSSLPGSARPDSTPPRPGWPNAATAARVQRGGHPPSPSGPRRPRPGRVRHRRLHAVGLGAGHRRRLIALVDRRGPQSHPAPTPTPPPLRYEPHPQRAAGAPPPERLRPSRAATCSRDDRSALVGELRRGSTDVLARLGKFGAAGDSFESQLVFVNVLRF